MIDISVVLNAHREGLLLHRTLRSIRRAMDEANARGLRVELVTVLDAADDLTARVAGRFQGISRIETVSYADLASARNHGARTASGRFLAFVDGDDLVSGNWFAAAYARFESESDPAAKLALHPHLNVYFGDEHYVYAHVDQAEPDFRFGNLVEFNYWTALAFMRRADALAMPYRPSKPAAGLGYEDWDWNCRTLAGGWHHHVVPGTFHFIRRQSRSMSLDFAATRAAVLPSPYFERLAEIADARAVEAWEASRRAAQAPSPQRRASSRLIRQAAAWLTGSRDGADVAVDHLAAGARALARRTPPPAPEPPPAPIDADLRAEWSALAAIEPALRAEAWPLSRYFLHRPPVSILPVPYAGLMEAWPVQAQHVIVSDRPDDPMTEQLLASLLATAGARRIAVVATGHLSASPLPSSAGPCLLSLTGDATGLDDTQRCAVLVRAILQRPPEALHLADSAVGRLALSRHAAALHEATRLHLHFAERDAGASTPHGRFAVFDLPRVARQVAAVSAGGPSCHHWLTEVVGLPPELVRAPSDRPAEPA